MDEPTFDRRTLMQTTGVLAGAGALGLLGTSSAAAEDGPIESTAGATEPQFELGEPEEIYVETHMEFEDADGEEAEESPTLYGEMVRPVDDNGEPIEDSPVILTYTPYGDLYKPLNDGESPAKDGLAEYFVPRGYTRVVVDLIGCRNSDGYYDYGGIRERLSGRDLVEDLADRAWSNGKVGMIGGSYDGTTQLAAAIEDPDGLEAIIPQVAIDRWYDYRHFGGCPRSTVGTPTLFNWGFAAVPPRAGDPAHNVDVTATRVEPSRRAEFEERSYEYDPEYDDFWEERDYRSRAENVDCAVMMEAGWEDRNVIRWGSTRFFEALDDVGHEEKRLVMGDWGHAAGQYPDNQDLYHAFYDEYLLSGDESWLDADADAQPETSFTELPAVDVQSESSPRAQFDEWPPEDAEEVALPLVRSDADQGELELLGGVAAWEDGSPPPEEDDFFDEQASGDDHLMLETPELDEEIQFTGRVTADLLAASTDDTWYTVVVYERDGDDVRPFARGAWNSRFHDQDNDTLGEPGETPTDDAYRVGVEAWDINWTVSEGNRLGIVIASDNDDYVRHDPSNESRNQLVLDESTLRFDGFAEGLETPSFPNVDLSREIDRGNDVAGEETSVHAAGWTARCTVTADSASDETSVRLPIPEGWEALAGDDFEKHEVAAGEASTTFVEFEDAVETGEKLTLYLQAPDETGDYEFGPVEYSSADGALWTAESDTAETAVVVGIETTL